MTTPNTPVILSACRTPMGRLQGTLASLIAAQLGAAAIRAAVERADVAPQAIEEVIMGNVLASGVGQAPARQAALGAGLPDKVAALTVNKVCGSGLKAIMLASQALRAGDSQVIVAGGMESMSHSPYLLARESPKLGDRQLIDSLLHDGLTCAFSCQSMGDIAEALASADGISRADLDRYAAESQRRAIGAQQEGAFADEMVPLTVAGRGGATTVDRDEGPRAESTFEKLSSLPPAFKKTGSVTAGNASMISDGAAAVVIASSEYAAAHGHKPLARMLASATSGGAPADLFLAPVTAVRMAVEKAGLKLADVDLFEINEAFAVQMLACLQRLEVNHDRVNVHGGAIALGHPIGASGARVVATLLHALRRRHQRFGVASLCLGGGNAVAAVFEALE
jgi:acetyl-CoA C-acetyltransferase